MANIQPIPDVRRTTRVFLEEAAPLMLEEVKAEVELKGSRAMGAGYYYEVTWPSIFIYCKSKDCDGDRFFDPEPKTSNLGHIHNTKLFFLIYTCRHCEKTVKIFAVSTKLEEYEPAKPKLSIMKYGENPPAIGPAPRALQDLLCDHWPLYIQGRRSELAGLGIGSFTYYRRVVENIWQTVLKRLVEVAQIEGSSDKVRALEAAQREREFTRSMDAAKGFIPASLYVDRHNPFQALYDACGDGLHAYSDEECIRRSTAIRLVLRRFSERAKEVLSEDAEFRKAVASIATKTGQET